MFISIVKTSKVTIDKVHRDYRGSFQNSGEAIGVGTREPYLPITRPFWQEERPSV